MTAIDTSLALPAWLDPSRWAGSSHNLSSRDVERALGATDRSEAELAALISKAADPLLESMAAQASAITARRFGRGIDLYVPLYLSNRCSNGCEYCGFASDRRLPRSQLSPDQLVEELAAIRRTGVDHILLLTGERCSGADFDYLSNAVELAAREFHRVDVEAFAMTEAEYGRLAEKGCTGITIYQETYHPQSYRQVHRWGPKRDFNARLQAPDRALSQGIRSVGIGVLLGLADPSFDLIALYRHVRHLQKMRWRSGVSIGFPRVRPEHGGYVAPHPVDERTLARYILAFRLCLPEVELVLSTRESGRFRDGIAGLGVTRFSVGSRTTVGGYATQPDQPGQFEVDDNRCAEQFALSLRRKGIEAVFKNWDAVYREQAAGALERHSWLA